MLPAWTNDYVGIPFRDNGRTREGLDCWGLIRLIYKEQFNIELPSFDADYFSTKDKDRIVQLVNANRSDWWEFPPGAEEAGDIVLIRIEGQPIHVAIALGDGQSMIHILKETACILDNYKKPLWNRRVLGFYRHDRLLDWEHTFKPETLYELTG